MKIIITGAEGLIGSFLYKKLLATENEVISLTRKDCDFTCLTSIKKETEKYQEIDVLIHCAAIAHSKDLYFSKRIRYLNSKITKNIVDGFLRFNPHFVFTSSISVYDSNLSQRSDTINPICESEYGKGKLDDEQYIKDHLTSYDLYRLFPIYSDNNKEDIFNRFYVIKNFLKIFLYPSLKYYFCSLNFFYETLSSRILHRGKRLHVLCDEEAFNTCLIKKNKGINISLPRKLFVLVLSFVKIFSPKMSIKLKKFIYPIDLKSFVDYVIKDN